jgi:hypothetical protein
VLLQRNERECTPCWRGALSGLDSRCIREPPDLGTTTENQPRDPLVRSTRNAHTFANVVRLIGRRKRNKALENSRAMREIQITCHFWEDNDCSLHGLFRAAQSHQSNRCCYSCRSKIIDTLYSDPINPTGAWHCCPNSGYRFDRCGRIVGNSSVSVASRNVRFCEQMKCPV